MQNETRSKMSKMDEYRLWALICQQECNQNSLSINFNNYPQSTIDEPQVSTPAANFVRKVRWARPSIIQ
jgi:hypothetical protein